MPIFRPSIVIVTWFLVLGALGAPLHGRACLQAIGCDMAIYNVSNSAELYDALANAQGGDTIELAGGDYGALNLSASSGFDVTYSSPVVIVSADPSAPASFSSMVLNGVANLTFDNVEFDYTFSAGDPSHVSPFSIANSADITIRNSVFEGDVATGVSAIVDGYGNGNGLTVQGSTGITIDNNEFTTWTRGLVVLESQDITVTANNIHSIRSDGMDFVEVQSVLIEGNYLHDFEHAPLSGDHSDMIQFWTTGTDAPSTDITIRGNILDIGLGNWTQSIFIRNELVDQGLAGPEMFYQNILIEENVILNGHIHGITVGETDGLTIRNNTVLPVDSSNPQFSSVPAINLAEASTNVTVELNAVSAIGGYVDQADWILQNNALIQNTDPEAPWFVNDLFVDSSIAGPVSGYLVEPGSLLDNLGAGAQSLFLDTTPDTLTANFEVATSSEASRELVFDASFTYGPLGQVVPADAEFHWTFGDGMTATGQIVQHVYSEPGHYVVALDVILPDGTISIATTTVGVAGEDILRFNSEDGQFYHQGYGSEAALSGSDAGSVSDGTGMVVDLGATGTVLTIPRAEIDRLFVSDAFGLSMTLQAELPGASSGEVLRLHSSFIVSVNDSGELIVDLFMDTGERITLTTSGASVSDGLAHDVVINFDDALDSLQILVDGTIAATTTAVGAMSSIGSWGIVFGNPWGGQNFDGNLIAFDLNADSNDYEIFEGVVPPSTPSGSQPVEDSDPGAPGGSVPEPDIGSGPINDQDPATFGEPVPGPEPDPGPVDDYDDEAAAVKESAFLVASTPANFSAYSLEDVSTLVGLNKEASGNTMLLEDTFVFNTGKQPATSQEGNNDYAENSGLVLFDGATDPSYSSADSVGSFDFDLFGSGFGIDEGAQTIDLPEVSLFCIV